MLLLLQPTHGFDPLHGSLARDEPQAILLTGPGDRKLKKAFEQAGIKHQFKLTDGRHEWTVWRHHLNDVAPLLFQ